MKKKFLYILSSALCMSSLLLASNSEAVADVQEVPSYVRFICTLFGQDPGNPADFFMFLGRFHPLVLHLPLGILALVLCFELYAFIKKSDQLHIANYLGLGVGAISAWIAVLFGSFLAMSNDFNPELINRHGWLGFILAICTTIAFLTKKSYIRSEQQNEKARKASLAALLVCGILMSLVGHDGGSLSHGKNYLFDYAPNFVRNAVGL